MFVPGNNPGMMQDAFIYGPDSIMLDLEDSVTMAEKDAARLLVYNALKTIDYGTTEMVVRINPLNTPYGKKDVEAMVKAGVHVIRMPKTETADEVREVEEEILKWEEELGCVGRTKIMAAIEKATGQKPTVFRAPYGNGNDNISKIFGLPGFNWSVDTLDWSSRNADSVVSIIKGSGDMDGGIILMHSIYDSTAEATEEIVPWLIDQGYQLVTISELMEYKYGHETLKDKYYGYFFYE